MGLIKSKAEKLQERKMAVKRSMKELQKRIQKLEAQQQVYIDAAKIAQREGLPDQLKLAKDALRMTISERKRTYKMLLNAQVISQMKDMSEMTTEFFKAVQIISKEMAGASSQDYAKVSNDLKIAMEKVSEQTDNLGEMLEDSQDDVGGFSTSTSLVTDDELDGLIFGTGSAGSSLSIDDELAELKKQLDS